MFQILLLFCFKIISVLSGEEKICVAARDVKQKPSERIKPFMNQLEMYFRDIGYRT